MVAARQFTPSLRKLTEAMAHDIPRSKFDFWFSRCAPVLALGCAAWVVFELVSTGNTTILHGSIAGLVAAGIICVALGWLLPRLVEKTRGMRIALTRRRYKFDAEALVLETADGGSVRTLYQSFRKVSIAPSHIAFYEAFPGYPAHVISSNEFESKDQERVVRDWIAVYAT